MFFVDFFNITTKYAIWFIILQNIPNLQIKVFIYTARLKPSPKRQNQFNIKPRKIKIPVSYPDLRRPDTLTFVF